MSVCRVSGAESGSGVSFWPLVWLSSRSSQGSQAGCVRGARLGDPVVPSWSRAPASGRPAARQQGGRACRRLAAAAADVSWAAPLARGPSHLRQQLHLPLPDIHGDELAPDLPGAALGRGPNVPRAGGQGMAIHGYLCHVYRGWLWWGLACDTDAPLRCCGAQDRKHHR